jgi:hypothetical protein
MQDSQVSKNNNVSLYLKPDMLPCESLQFTEKFFPNG